MTTLRDRYRGCLLGLAVGDALGTTLEFRQRDAQPWVTGMTGGGPFALRPGQWTDDTSMAMCLAESLVECPEFDAKDQMDRYARWVGEGYWSCIGRCFDVGNITATAIVNYLQTGNPLAGSDGPRSAGNGSLMRLAPVAMRYPCSEVVANHARLMSRTTHAHPECIAACGIFGRIVRKALNGERDKLRVLTASKFSDPDLKRLKDIEKAQYIGKARRDVRGSGYVVDCLEAALWAFEKGSSFEECVLLAVNLADDADTTGAVCGQLAGAYYGESGIPADWLDVLAMRNDIALVADALLGCAHGKFLVDQADA